VVEVQNNPQQRRCPMELYAGMDLHSRNTFVGVIDSSFKRVFEKRVPNDLSLIVDKLEPFGDRLAGMMV
jgi:hypothetical protein